VRVDVLAYNCAHVHFLHVIALLLAEFLTPVQYMCVFLFLFVCMCVCIQVARNLLNFGIGRLRLVDCQVPLDACYKSSVWACAREERAHAHGPFHHFTGFVCVCVCVRARVRARVGGLISAIM